MPCLAALAVGWVGIAKFSRYKDKHASIISCHSLGHDALAFTTKYVDSPGHSHYSPASIVNHFGSLGHNGSASTIAYVGSTGLKTGPASTVTYVGSTGHKTSPASIVAYASSTGELSCLTFAAICFSDAESTASFVRIGGNDSFRLSLLSKKDIAESVLSSWPFANKRDDGTVKQKQFIARSNTSSKPWISCCNGDL